MKSGSVASVAVLLGLGVLAGVSFLRERDTMVQSERNLSMKKVKHVIDDIKTAMRIKKERVQAVVDKLELDDDRDLPQLYDYIMDQQFKQYCMDVDKSCSMVAISFTVSSEGGAGTDHTLKFQSSDTLSSFSFAPKNPGETDMKAREIDFTSYKYKLERGFRIKARSKDAAIVRINWVFNRVRNVGANRNEYLVSVAPNNEGYNCYSKEREYVGNTFCYPGWKFGTTQGGSSYPWNNPYSDPWDAFDNAQISRRVDFMW